jgi:hypothetical protein
MILRKKFNVYEEEVAHFKKEDVKGAGSVYCITIIRCYGSAWTGVIDTQVARSHGVPVHAKRRSS